MVLIVAASEGVSAEDLTVVEVASGVASEATEAVLAIEVGMVGEAVLAIRIVEGLVTDEVGMVALLMPLVVLAVEVGMVVVVVAPMDMTTEETGMAIVEAVVGMEESREALLEVIESPSVAETEDTTTETGMAEGATTIMAPGSGNTRLMGTTTQDSGEGTDRAPSTLASFNINCIIVVRGGLVGNRPQPSQASLAISSIDNKTIEESMTCNSVVSIFATFDRDYLPTSITLMPIPWLRDRQVHQHLLRWSRLHLRRFRQFQQCCTPTRGFAILSAIATLDSQWFAMA